MASFRFYFSADPADLGSENAPTTPNTPYGGTLVNVDVSTDPPPNYAGTIPLVNASEETLGVSFVSDPLTTAMDFTGGAGSLEIIARPSPNDTSFSLNLESSSTFYIWRQSTSEIVAAAEGTFAATVFPADGSTITLATDIPAVGRLLAGDRIVAVLDFAFTGASGHAAEVLPFLSADTTYLQLDLTDVPSEDDTAPGGGAGDTTIQHAALSVARLITELRGTTVEDMVSALAVSSQSMEHGAQTLRLRNINEATGAQLDGLGAIVGQERLAFLTDDEVYRTWIRARILLNRCGGTAEEILHILSLLAPDATIKLKASHPAGIVLSVLGAVTADQANALFGIAATAVSGGVRMHLVYNLTDPADIFTLDGTPDQSLDAGELAGVGVI